MLVLLLLAGCGNGDNDYNNTNNDNDTDIAVEAEDSAIILNGRGLSRGDIDFFTHMAGGDVNTGIQQLIEFQLIIDHAYDLGLALSAAERDAMREEAVQQAGFLGLGDMVTEDRLIDFFSVGALLTRIGDYYTDEITPDFTSQEFLLFKLDNVNRLADLQVNYILTTDRGALVDIAIAMEQHGAANFENYAREHCLFYGANNGLVTESLADFLTFTIMLDDRYVEDLFSLQAGDLSPVITVDEFSILVYVQSRTEASDSDFEAVFRNHYIAQSRGIIIEDVVDGLIANAQYIIN